MKKLILCIALLCPTLAFAQAAPLGLSVTFKGRWSESHGYGDECKGESPLVLKFNGDLEPYELKYWNATTRRWQGEGEVSVEVAANVLCTRNLGMSDKQQGVKPTFARTFDRTGMKGYASVLFEEHEDGVIRYRINLGLKGGSCKMTMWSYESDGSSDKIESSIEPDIFLEETGPDGGEHEITPATPFTKQDLLKGFNRTQRIAEAAPSFCGLNYGTTDDEGAGEWTWTMSYAPNASKATLALNVCSDVGLGSATNMRATATPPGGKLTFKSSKSDVVQVLPMGLAATITALQPGSATVDVEYEGPAGERATASEVIHTIQVKDVNKGAPVRLGLYDVKGNKKNAQRDVPIEVLPQENARRVIFKPADATLVSSVASDATSLTITALKPGKTTVQAETSCGAKTGPALGVEVVPCESEVITQLKAEEKALRTRIEANIREITQITGDDEFDRAAREGPEHIKELAQKTIELLGKLAAKAGGGAHAERFAKGIDQVADAMSIGEMLDAALNDKYELTSSKAAEMAGDKILDKLTDDEWGVAKTAYEAGKASAALGQDLGTMMGAAERLQELEEQLDANTKELDRVWHVLHKLCAVAKQPSAPKPQPKPSAKPKTDPTRVTAKGQPKETEVPKPAEPVEPEGPPKEPPPPDPASPKSIGLYAEEVEKKCAVFTLPGADGPFKSIGAQAEATREVLRDFIAAAKLPEAEKKVSFATLRDKMKANPPSRFATFAKSLEKTAAQAESCAPVLQNSFEVKLEEITAKYF